MAFHDLATSCVMEQAELGGSRYEPAVTLRFGCAAEFRHSRIVSNLDDIAVWAKNLATLKLRPPPVLASKSSAGWRESRRAMGPHRRRRNSGCAS